MMLRRTALAALLVLSGSALAGLAPPAAATGTVQVDCDFIVFTDPVQQAWYEACGAVNGLIGCDVTAGDCLPCVPPRGCVRPCTPPEVGVTIGNVQACVDGTPPNSVGTTCPAAYGGGKGIYIDQGPVGASPEDDWLCVSATPGGAPCAPGEVRVELSSSLVNGFVRCVSATPPTPCSTPGNGWGVGFGSSCLVYLPWAEPSPPAPTTCPPGTLAPVRIWWGQTPGFAPGSFTDVCLV